MAYCWGQPTRDSPPRDTPDPDDDRMSWWRTFTSPWRVEHVVTVDIPNQLKSMEALMGAREDAAYEKLNATILTVKDGWASLVAERDALKAALEDADADAAAQVAAALDADSDVDASKVEAADSALAELVAVAEPEPGE